MSRATERDIGPEPQFPPDVGYDHHAAMQKGLPVNIDAEKFIIGSVFLDDSRIPEIAATITQEDFSLEKHRRIWRRIMEIHGRSEKVDRVTVANELIRYGELQSVDGLGYLISLDEGLPSIAGIGAYTRIVRDKAALRKLANIGQHLMNRAIMGEESPDDILAGVEEQILGIGETRQSVDEGLRAAGDFLRNFPGGFSAFVEPAKRENGIKTGFTKLDQMTGGFRPGELIIIGARPGAGKSALALNIAWNIAALQNEAVAIFSLEMSMESLLLRMLCAASRTDSQRLRSGYLGEQERHRIRIAANQMAEAPIYIDDSSNVGLMEMHAKVRHLENKIKTKVRLVIVDYLQLMASRGKQENRNQEVSRIARGLKLLSKTDQLDCPILALSQLSRATEQRAGGDKRAQLSDFKESGGLEENADLVGALFREEMYKRDREDLHGVAELNILKQRQGPVGRVDLVWLAAMTRFENRAEDFTEEDNGRLPYAED